MAAAVRRASAASPVEFTRRRVEEKAGEEGGRVVMPSPDFRRLCVEQLQLFRMVVHRDAALSVGLDSFRFGFFGSELLACVNLFL